MESNRSSHTRFAVNGYITGRLHLYALIDRLICMVYSNTYTATYEIGYIL